MHSDAGTDRKRRLIVGIEKYNLSDEQHEILQCFVNGLRKPAIEKKFVGKNYKMNNLAIRFLKNCIDSCLFLDLLQTTRTSRRL